MITSPVFAGKRYAVLGLARSGAATVRALLASGARVTAWDSDEGKRAVFTGEVGLTLADPLAIDLADFDGVVVSPGVPLNTHPIAAHAHAAGVPVIGDIELFAQARASLPAHKVVGITGTNGKSTTTALVRHICEVAGLPNLMGGNIGVPILGQEPLAAGGVYVLELSSFQLDLTFSLDCDVAVLLNITPDHLDRYDGFEAYVSSKQRLFELQSDQHWAVITEDDTEADDLAYRLEHELDRWRNVVRPHGATFTIRQNAWPALQGPHNAQNAAAAIAVAQALAIDLSTIEASLRTYPGLPHRMERIAEHHGVLYVNDSKATNPTSAAPALAAYPRVHWIVGGLPKSDDLDACAPHFGHVVTAYTIGEAGPMFATLLRGAGITVVESGTLADAVAGAASLARSGDTVLLSPACASYDQFRDYEARGDAFRSLVEGLS